MPGYTEVVCRSREAANALHAYLLSQLNEDEDAPPLIACVEEVALRITYNRDSELQREAWDKQLIGFRDGFELCQSLYEVPFKDSERLSTGLSDEMLPEVKLTHAND